MAQAAGFGAAQQRLRLVQAGTIAAMLFGDFRKLGVDLRAARAQLREMRFLVAKLLAQRGARAVAVVEFAPNVIAILFERMQPLHGPGELGLERGEFALDVGGLGFELADFATAARACRRARPARRRGSASCVQPRRRRA